MIRLAAVILALLGAAHARPAAPVGRLSSSAGPFHYNALGPVRDVTEHWRAYQPAGAFCVKPETPEYTPGGIGHTVTGANPACRHSGFARSARALVVVRVRTPTLCPGCRRLFIDSSKIPAADHPPDYYPRGHVFFRLVSPNFTYTMDPIGHSPNTKNFTNDKLLAPNGSPQEQIIGAFDLHQAFGYVTDTANFVHTKVQGPYYIGPWYVSAAGRRIRGVYVDVDVADATQFPGGAQANEIAYATGFNARRACPGDQDSFYGGCVDWWAYSTSTVNPYTPLR